MEQTYHKIWREYCRKKYTKEELITQYMKMCEKIDELKHELRQYESK